MAIVAPVDRSDRAIDVLGQAEPLAEAFDETVHIIHVLDRSTFLNLERTSIDKSGSAIPMSDVRNVALEIATEKAEHIDAPVEPVGLVGDPAEEVVEYAEDCDARYIITAGRKRSPTGKAIFGSVGQSIIMNATCPVLISIEG